MTPTCRSLSRAVVAVGLSLFAACGSAEVSPELSDNLRQIGVNHTALDDVSAEQWVDLARAGCEQGAWENPATSTLALDFIETTPGADQLDPEGMVQTVWLLTITFCRDDIPEGGLIGPPHRVDTG
ncbi:MAG TPA: hypothetical protein ENH15_05930 [Actinobacteria bacterium]|nr:hypothetical protein [Actinomycetota bacterium]